MIEDVKCFIRRLRRRSLRRRIARLESEYELTGHTH